MRNQLRSATRDIHQQLDDFVAGLQPLQSRDAYNIYLNAMHGLYTHYGEPLDIASQWNSIPESSDALRNAIVKDLTGTPHPVSQLNKQDSFTEHEIWATVLEGSAMGARYMVKALANGQAQLPHHYLTKLAEDSYDRWPKFVSGLESAEINVDETSDAALKIFQNAFQIFQSFASTMDSK